MADQIEKLLNKEINKINADEPKVREMNQQPPL